MKAIQSIGVSLVVCVCLGTGSFGQGTVVYSSFAPNGDFDHNGGGYVDSSIPEIGFQFVPSLSGNLQSIDVPLFWGFGPNAGQLLLCRTDLQTGFPSTPLETFSISNLPSNDLTDRTKISSFSSTLLPRIEAGQPYWLVLASEPGGELFWNVSLTAQDSFYSIQNGSKLIIDEHFETGRSGAFRVSVVPEPTTSALILGGVALVIMRRAGAKTTTV